MSNTPTLPFPFLKDVAAETEAKTFADSLVTRYHAQRVKLPHLNTICIDLTNDFPAKDSTIERAGSLLANWTLDFQEYKATDGRAGCVWMTPKFPIS